MARRGSVCMFASVTVATVAIFLGLGGVGAGASTPSADPTGATLTRVSVGPHGQGNNSSGGGGLSVSADGRYVAFFSLASNLVSGDTNNFGDIFVWDGAVSMVRRVSVGLNGGQPNQLSVSPVISANGRYVAFDSWASNLVARDTNHRPDVFLWDRARGVTTRVAVGLGGAEPNSFSHDAALSADGRYVAFDSEASNLVPGDTNNADDVFVRDRVTGVITRASVGPGGAQGDRNHGSGIPAISADGRYVAFASSATNLVAGEVSTSQNVFVRDRVADETTRVSAGMGGAPVDNSSSNPAISADGRYVAFESFASNLVAGDTNDALDVFVWDRITGQTTRVSVGPGGAQGDTHSYGPSISAHGRYVGFNSEASNLVTGDTNNTRDLFVRDRAVGETRRMSVGPNGAESDGDSFDTAISPDGRFFAFASAASNLVPGDTNDTDDVFLWTLW